MSDELRELLRARPELRRFLFWEQAAQPASRGRSRPTRYHAIPPGNATLWRISAADLDWLECDALSREHITERLLAFDSFMSIAVPDARAEEIQVRSERLAASHIALTTHFQRRAKKFNYAHPEEARWARQRRVLENKQHKTRVARLAWFREHLEEIRSGESQHALIWLCRSVPSWDEEKIEVIVRDLSERLDAEIAQAAQEGWRRSWRTVECPLPHERKERNVISDTAMIGLAGIAVDVKQGLDLASLSEEAATQAARLATHAMSSFPPWIDPLVRHHGPCVQPVFEACIRADYSVPAQHRVLGFLAHAPKQVREICAPVLEELIQAADPGDTRALELVLEALLSLPARRAVLAQLAPEKCAGDTSNFDRFALWWAVWFAEDPATAVQSLATQIAADGDRAGDRVLVLCGQILSWLDEDHQARFELPDHARALTSFLAIVLTYVHPSDDVRRVGADSPETRNEAEWLRGLLIQRLASIPGQETINGLIQLANDPRWPEWRDWLLSLADRRRADDLSVAANDVAAKLFKAYQAHGLATPDHLAEAGLRIASLTAGREHPNMERRLPMQKLTILFLAANPIGIDQRALDREARAIQQELASTGQRDCFDFVTRWAAEPLDLLRALRTLKPAVVHFSGHGGARSVEASETTVSAGEWQHGLYFQNANGEAQWVSAEALAQAFSAAGASVQLVVLNACYSDTQAAALLSYVPCVVGMTGVVDDAAARHFATGFYGGLGEGASVADAYQHGRAAISLIGLADADKTKLQTRAGIDASRLVLAGHEDAPGSGRISASGNASAPRVTPSAEGQPPSARATGAIDRATAPPTRPHVDIGILTIRPDEFRAVLDVFPAKAGPGVYRSASREYTLRLADVGHGGRYNVAVLRQIEQGNGEAQDAARDLLQDLAPKLVLVVGIAGGLPSDISLGDVVVGTRIHDLTVEARDARDGVTYAATGGPIDRRLAASVANLEGRDEISKWSAALPPRPAVTWAEGQLYGPTEWQDKLREKLERHHGATAAPRAPVFLAGPIASSDRLVKDPLVLFPWIATARNLLAVEMESGGVYRALRERCPMLPIRGISDLVGLQRSEAWISFACASAAAFAAAFLRTRPVPVGDSVASDPP